MKFHMFTCIIHFLRVYYEHTSEKEKQPNTVKAGRRMSHLPNDRELQTQIP